MEKKTIDITAAAQKKELRRSLLTKLKALTPDERRVSDAQIRRRVEAMPQFRRAKRLFLFAGADWEVDTWPLIEAALAAGKQVAVPRCLPPPPGADGQASAGGLMEACLIKSREDLRRMPPLGLWEPAEGTPVLSPASLDFALIPCVACDGAGGRLGRGGGYYDRFLTDAIFVKAALCRQAVLQELLPTQAHDKKMDFIITENAILHITNGSENSQNGQPRAKPGKNAAEVKQKALDSPELSC